MSLQIIHDLSKLTPEAEAQYLRDVSVFIGLDPDLNGLDTIWMPNENGPGQSKVVYARRGTAEILREIHGIEVSTLTHEITAESAVFTATGKNKTKRQEVAIGSKSVRGLGGQAYDNAVMTASTRALRRLTMQFTKLGILDVSEIEGTKAEAGIVNPAAGATLAGSAVVIPPPQVAPNNKPGKVVEHTVIDHVKGTITQEIVETRQLSAPNVEPEVSEEEKAKAFSAQQQALRDEAKAQLLAKPTPESAPATEAAPARPKRTRKPKNSVSLGGVEPEVVNNVPQLIDKELVATAVAVMATAKTIIDAQPSVPVAVPATVPTQANPAVPTQAYSAPAAPTQVNSAPVSPDNFAGKPTDAQMAEYRKTVSVYTSELPSSENLGSVQKMRAFITHMSGTAPQYMTTDQWQEMISWFESFVGKNGIKGLVKYINDTLGVK